MRSGNDSSGDSNATHSAQDGRSHWRPDIQGLRAIAVLMVVAFHAHLSVDGGFAGVDVFFVVSGYVIAAMLEREWRTTGRIDLARFYLRRSLRLLPALALVVAAVALASGLFLAADGSAQVVARTAIAALGFVANLVIARREGDYFAPAATENPLLHTWSLSLEEQFYFVLPALLLVSFRVGRFLHRPLAFAAFTLFALSAASFGLALSWTDPSSSENVITSAFGGPQTFAFYSLPSRAWEFGVGCLVALAVSRGATASRAFSDTIAYLGLGLIGASAILLDGSSAFPGWLTVGPVAGTALLLFSGAGAATTVHRVLSASPLVRLGDLSYSIYLWHWPLIVFAEKIAPDSESAPMIAAMVSFAPALLTFERLERPLRRWRPQSSTRAGFALASIALVPLLASAVLLKTASIQQLEEQSDSTLTSAPDAKRSDRQRSWRSAHAVVAAGCVAPDFNPSACRFGPADARGWILLVGDSQAYAMADGLIEAANGLGYTVVASSHVACPFVGRLAFKTTKQDCAEWQKEVLDFALSSKPDAVVIANRGPLYIYPKSVLNVARRTIDSESPVVAQRVAKYGLALDEVIAPLQGVKIPVLLFTSIPELPSSSGTRQIVAQTSGGPAVHVDRRDAIAHRRPVYETELAASRRYEGVHVFDPFEALCTDTCPTAVNGTLLYQDATHLSLDGALRLAPGLTSALRQALQLNRAGLQREIAHQVEPDGGHTRIRARRANQLAESVP